MRSAYYCIYFEGQTIFSFLYFAYCPLPIDREVHILAVQDRVYHKNA